MINILKIIRHYIHNWYDFSLSALNTAYYFLTPKNNRIVINGFFTKILGHVSKNNFGDDLNFYIVKNISGKRIFSAQNLLVKSDNLLFIGSILQKYITPYSIVWGAGTISHEYNPKETPKEIRAVRGPLTRKWLSDNGIECPEIFSDPALLLPLIYMPKTNKKYKYGIIPHYVDWNSANVNNLTELLDSNYKLISMSDYQSVESLVDSINSCEYIISSSLHGLIISDAYNIPNIWVEFSDKVVGDRFKFQDYFLSIGRKVDSTLQISRKTTHQDINKELSKYGKGQINIIPFLNNSPIDINPQILKKAEEYYKI